MTSEIPDAEPVSEEFEAFRQEFLDHLFPEDMPEAQRQMWRDLR